MNKVSISHVRQQGAALFISLVFLIVLTLISVSAMQNSIIEKKIAANLQYSAEASELSQAVIEATISDTDNFKVIGDSGHTYCYNKSEASDGTVCNDTDALNLDSKFNNDSAITGNITSEVKFIGEAPPPRNFGYEMPGFNVGLFDVEGEFDDSAKGNGRANTTQGFIILITNP